MNPYRALIALLPTFPLQVGNVVAINDGIATVQLPGGNSVQVRGQTNVGAYVFFRDGVIEGPAPNLPIETIEV